MHVESSGYYILALCWLFALALFCILLLDVCECILLFSTHTHTHTLKVECIIITLDYYIDRAFRYIYIVNCGGCAIIIFSTVWLANCCGQTGSLSPLFGQIILRKINNREEAIRFDSNWILYTTTAQRENQRKIILGVIHAFFLRNINLKLHRDADLVTLKDKPTKYAIPQDVSNRWKIR